MMNGRPFFAKTNRITNNVRHQMFYYKIVHKNYASNLIVSKFDPTVNANCRECNIACDIIHTFVNCICVQPLWNLLTNWLKLNFEHDINFDVTTRLKILGVITSDRIKNQLELDFILLHAKLYIHICRKEEFPISFISFLKYLKHEVLIEKLSNKRNVPTVTAMNEIESVL